MAKHKDKSMDEPKVAEEMTEAVVEAAPEESTCDEFLMRTLKAINQMQNPVKAERLANRLLRKRR